MLMLKCLCWDLSVGLFSAILLLHVSNILRVSRLIFYDQSSKGFTWAIFRCFGYIVMLFRCWLRLQLLWTRQAAQLHGQAPTVAKRLQLLLQLWTQIVSARFSWYRTSLTLVVMLLFMLIRSDYCLLLWNCQHASTHLTRIWDRCRKWCWAILREDLSFWSTKSVTRRDFAPKKGFQTGF